MKYLLVLPAIGLLAACAGGGTAPSPSLSGELTATPARTGATAGPADNDAFGSLLNDARVDAGAGTVAFDNRLANAAQVHADDMLDNDFLSHTGSDGSSVGDRARAANYDWRTIGENIGQGHANERAIFQGWTDSPSHNANNLDARFEDFGLAKAGTGADVRWVLVLGAEK